jgi:quinate dehydrogenase (quinone)
VKRSLLLILISATALFAADRSFDTWSQYLGGADSSQYSSLKQINKSNVKQLQVSWTYQTGGASLLFDPLVVDGTMYIAKAGPTGTSLIVALDGATGKELWTHTNQGGVATRGMNYWESKDRRDRRLVYLNAGILTEISTLTGETIQSFGDNGRVDPRLGDRNVARPTNNPGRIYEDTIIVSMPAGGASYDSTPGDVHAYDVRTGMLKWVFHSVPLEGEFGSDTWPKEALANAGGVHNWNEMTVDTQRGIIFIPFGTARYDFYGGNRKGNDLFANSLVALDAKTGKRLWHYQLVHHDLWDYDIPTAPKLLTVRHNGKSVDVVAQPTKHGFLFVFNRQTGEPLWPIEERAVPQSDVPGEFSSPTQPFPTLPPPFARQSFTEKDINPFMSAEQQETVRQMLRDSRNEGLFTPPSLRGSIELPGHNGGANWGSSAVDPTKGTMYIVSKELPTLMKLNPPGARSTGGARGGGAGRGGRGGVPGAGPEQGGGAAPAPRGGNPPQPAAYRPPDFVAYDAPYNFMTTANATNGASGFSIMGPPWSQLTAYDLNAGKILWQVPNGGVSALGEAGKNIGSVAPRGGVVVTAGGLVFAGTTSDRKFRAYDQDSGKVLWETDMPAPPEGVPSIYQAAGREYIAVPTGGAGIAQPRALSAAPIPQAAAPGYVVFALPKK